MATEIEHKYLLKPDLWKTVVPEQSVDIRQGYLLTDPDKTIRVRTKGSKGYFTVKGRSTGASRLEFEYEIPVADAIALIKTFSAHVVEKTRHLVTYAGKLWEVDEFKGLNEGLLVAEIELASEREVYDIPPWVDKDVTADNRYANSMLSVHPYTTW